MLLVVWVVVLGSAADGVAVGLAVVHAADAAVVGRGPYDPGPGDLAADTGHDAGRALADGPVGPGRVPAPRTAGPGLGAAPPLAVAPDTGRRAARTSCTASERSKPERPSTMVVLQDKTRQEHVTVR